MFRISRLSILMYSFLFLLISTISAQAGTTILFDQGHGQKFLIERGAELDLSLFAGTFRDLGHQTAISSAPLSEMLLDGVDALVISGSFRPYAPEEVDAVYRFVERGGAVCITLHIASPLSDLLYRFGVDHSNGVIREAEGIIDHEMINFHVTRLGAHPLFRNLQQFNMYGAWALLDNNSGERSIARTSPTAWIDLNGNKRFDEGDARQSFTVAVAGEVGKGCFVIFGDDAMFQNKFLKDDNLILARNLATWLADTKPAAPKLNTPDKV